MPFLTHLPAAHPKSSVLVALGVVYLCVVRALRWRRYNAIQKKYAAKFQAKTLTPEEAQEVLQLVFTYDMPTLSELSVAFSTYKTYGIPSMSKLFLETKQLGAEKYVARRFADTEILVYTCLACPLSGRSAGLDPGAPADDPRCPIALARINWLHSKYKISNGDYLYTLGLYMLEPSAWAARFGWRPHSPLERYASYVYWTGVGRKMNIKDLPSSLEEYEEWLRVYEEEHLVAAQCNHDVAKFTTGEILFSVPEGGRSFFANFVMALLEKRYRVAMLQPEPPAYATYTVHALLGLTAFIERNLLLPRSVPWAYVPIGLPKFEFGSQTVPRQFPTKFTSKPWYKPRNRGLARLIDRLLVAMNMHDDVPRPELKSDGYKLYEVGPSRYENEGHEQVMKMAEELQGCPMADAWRPTKTAA